MRNRQSSTFVRLGLAALLAAPIAVGWHALSASAAFPGETYETEFEIDGNTVVDSGQDWDSDPAAAPNLQGAPFETTELCGGTDADPNRITSGTKIDDILVAAPPVEPGNVNTKSDLCAVYGAWELVFVPTADASDDPGAGQYNFILYGGWSRPDVNGEIDVLFPLLGDDPNSNADDLIISYDFVDSQNTTTVEVLAWDGDSWELTTLANGAFEAVTMSAGGLTFGEFALNLTASGILPADGPCTTFSTGDPITRTGNSANATLEDIVDTTPINLTNCGSLTINKLTQPETPAGSPSFTTLTNQLDGHDIQFDGVTELTDHLVVPDDASVTHTGMLISPDYVVTEAALPAGWSEVSLVCTSFDPIVGAEVTRTLFANGDDGPDATFPIAPGVEAVCDVSNVGPPAVSVTKTVDGTSADWAFDFTISPDPDGPGGQDATQTATAANPTVTWELQAGVAYTITETPVDGFITGVISCGEGGATFTPEPGDEIECSVTNTELVALDVATAATASFDRTISWSLDKSVAPTSHTANAGGTASSTWTVVATKTVTAGNFGVTGTVTVTNGNDFAVPFTIASSLDDSTVTNVNCTSLTVPANGSVVCTFTATPGDATATVATAVVTPTDPILDAVSETASVSFLANVIGDETVTVDDDRDTEGQFPIDISATTTFNYDETFTCSNNPADYASFVDTDTYPNTATLTGDDTNLSDSASVAVTCNLPPASVDVSKTVAGGASTWSFDFTISPVPAGETGTKSATNAAPTVGWDGLVPGAAYTITEAGQTGFTSGTLACTGGTNGVGTSTFTPTAGQAVTCGITNDVVQQQAPPIADIAVVKTATPTVVTPGGNVTWTLRVTNNGPDAADTVSIVDNLPTSLTLVSFTSPAGWDCSGSVAGNPGRLSCTKPTMGFNESATFTLTTTVAASAAGQTIDNTAVVSTSTSETTTSNNQDSEPITVQVAVLPPTGGYVWNRLAIAAMLVLAGTALLAVDRRRRILS